MILSILRHENLGPRSLIPSGNWRNVRLSRAAFRRFAPDACLINCYDPGARLTLHQDKNERNFDAPIVSVSLGLPAKFLFGGLK
jgi:alkylated DNA repair dioxygenase AlkB